MKNRTQLADGYYRLSREEAKGGESASIKNQREIVQAYCKEQGIVLVREFVDDGYSGANFDRPDFQQMLMHLKTDKVNMVITKDLSRLGRDMSEASYYAERYFPEQSIQYIAISDHFDSDGDNMMAPFQFAMNDVYLRDTSRKVRQVLTHKKKNGLYSACPPFGYRKDNRCRDRLVPDENTAPTVKRIFELAADGYSCRSIAETLNRDTVIPPLKYRVLYRDEFSESGAAHASDEWNYITVKRILRNRVYLGHTLLGKSKKVSVKSKLKLPLPEDEWLVTQDTHEPLVTQAQFDRAEHFMGKNTRTWRENPAFRLSIFGGVAFCSSCGGAMCSGGSVYKGEREKYWYLVCNSLPKRSAKRCETGARIKYGTLLEIVRQDLNRVLHLSDKDMREITDAAVKAAETRNGTVSLPDQISVARHRIGDIDKIVGKLYQDNISGKIDDDRLDRMVAELEAESTALKEKQTRLQKGISDSALVRDSYQAFFELAKKYRTIEVLDREIVTTFIERIEIGPKILPEGLKIAGPKTPYRQMIRIHYRFIGELTQEHVRDVPGGKPATL